MLPVFKEPATLRLILRKCRTCGSDTIQQITSEKSGYPSNNWIVLSICLSCKNANVHVAPKSSRE